MLGAGIRIEPVVESFAKGKHVAAGPRRCFENSYVVSAAHELPGATQIRDACAGHNDLLEAFRIGLWVRQQCGRGKRQDLTARESAPRAGGTGHESGCRIGPKALPESVNTETIACDHRI
jgi:hypothetical protein